ncbi:hypothetical protein [Actinomadura oligospora]|uniref:hypothetical protein n=1 Tax=Actinomadura oligospora TaxID=111804 RepID=UPI0004B42370|nr:hypothetical protein [Actinomadura oligospora]
MQDERDASAAMTLERLWCLARLMVALRLLGRGSTVTLPGVNGQPVMYVPVGPSARKMAVLAVQGASGGWSFCWDGDQTVAADDTMRAAHWIAAVKR